MEDYKMKLAPIILFTYNRPRHTKETVEALLLNELANESELIIISDAAKNEEAAKGVDETRQYLKTITGFKSIQIIERETNYGLANNIIDGVTTVVNEYGKVIVLEDDLLTSPFFLTYINEALDIYQNEEDVISIHSYVYPIKRKLPETFFLRGADCLGWATWKRGWDLFNPNGVMLKNEIEEKKLIRDFNYNNSYHFFKMLTQQIAGQNNSWAIRWYASAFLKNKLTLHPGRSLIFHNGSDGSGTHCGASEELDVKLTDTPIFLKKNEIKENQKARNAYIHYFRYTRILKKIKSRLKRLLK